MRLDGLALFTPPVASGNPMTTKDSSDLSALLDGLPARTCRHLRFMKALFEIDDPELEHALAVVLERLASAAPLPRDTVPESLSPKTSRRRKLPPHPDQV